MLSKGSRQIIKKSLTAALKEAQAKHKQVEAISAGGKCFVCVTTGACEIKKEIKAIQLALREVDYP